MQTSGAGVLVGSREEVGRKVINKLKSVEVGYRVGE